MSERKDDPRKSAPAAVKPVTPAPPRAVFSSNMGGAAAAARLQPARVGEDKPAGPPARPAPVTQLKARPPAPAKAKPAKAKSKTKPKAKAKAKRAPSKSPLPVMPAWGPGLGGAALMDGYQSLTEAAGEGWRAATEASERLMKNAEKVGKEMTAFADEEFEAQAAAVRDLSKCRNFESLVQTQSALAKARLGRLTAHTERMQRMSLALARESFAPLEAQFDKTATRFIRKVSP